VIEEGDCQGMVFPLHEKVVSIGRGPDNAIQIIDSRMSRRHALVMFNSGSWIVRDMGSKNGVMLNDAQLQVDQLLANGDRLTIGDTVLVFEQDGRVADTSPGVAAGMRVQKDNSEITPSDVVRLGDAPSDVSPIFGIAPGDDQRLGMLYQVAEMTISILDQDELLDKLIDLIQRFLQPHRAGILLYDEKYEILLPKVIRRPPDSTEDIIISNSIIDKAIMEQSAVLVSDAPHDVRFRGSESIVIQRIHSAICAPLIYKGEVLGVLYLDRRRPAESYTPRDLKLVAGIANQAALTIANSRLHRRLLAKYAQERELEIARSIQEKLLPREMPELPGYQVAGMSRPARMVGGDYFDVITLADGRVMLVVADVSGKGVPAAILLAAFRAELHVEASRFAEEPLTALVARLNQMTYRDTSSNMFITMILALLDTATGSLTYCNAGHAHPMLHRPDGHVQSLDVGGCLLGVISEAEYEQATLTLEPGAALVMYSDGVTDTLDAQGETFGAQRLSDAVDAYSKLSADTICVKIDHEAQDFRGDAEPFDDFTLLVLKATEKPASSG
jgi:serine phosphatase RsbU (regulator of sigma subunit)